jgi:hypothetical protein
MLLRGAGVAMALPWLEPVPVWGAEAAAAASAEKFPKRFAALFMACGINSKHWWAKGSGEEMELGKSLEPLAPLKTKLNYVSGLFNRAAVGVGIHPGQTGNILSGAALQKGAELRGGISVDQVLANSIGQETAQPSLVLGCEQPVTGYHETNFSMAYSSHISWQNTTSPVPMEVYPSLAVDSLFDNRGSRRNKSVLDRVQDEAARLSRQVSSGDKAKLDEYLTSVREVEKRIDRARSDQSRAQASADHRGQNVVTMPRPDNGLPEDIREHMRLMCISWRSPFRPTRRASRRCCCAAIFRACSIRFSMPARPTTPRRTTIFRTSTSAFPDTIAASSRISPRDSMRCPRAKGRCSITPACCSSRTCGPAASTTAPSCPW